MPRREQGSRCVNGVGDHEAPPIAHDGREQRRVEALRYANASACDFDDELASGSSVLADEGDARRGARARR